MALVWWVAPLGDHVGSSPVTSEMVRMLARGNTADVTPWARACGFPPRPLPDALDPSTGDDRTCARLYFVRPLLRLSVAFIWLATAVICAFVYPRAESYALLAVCGITGSLAPLSLYGACALDGFLGTCLLLRWHTRPLLIFQAALVTGYSLAILFCLPEYWLHPFGPLTKNVPLLGAILALWAVED